MAGEKYTNIGKARWENANVGVIKWDPENKAGLASVIDEATGTVYEIGGGGEGGESDFSTAEVTLLNSLGDGMRGSYAVILPVVADNKISMQAVNVQRGNTVTVEIPLYKDVFSIPYISLVNMFPNLQEDPLPEISGNITDNGSDSYVITGNCTLNGAGPLNN